MNDPLGILLLGSVRLQIINLAYNGPSLPNDSHLLLMYVALSPAKMFVTRSVMAWTSVRLFFGLGKKQADFWCKEFSLFYSNSIQSLNTCSKWTIRFANLKNKNKNKSASLLSRQTSYFLYCTPHGDFFVFLIRTQVAKRETRTESRNPWYIYIYIYTGVYRQPQHHFHLRSVTLLNLELCKTGYGVLIQAYHVIISTVEESFNFIISHPCRHSYIMLYLTITSVFV